MAFNSIKKMAKGMQVKAVDFNHGAFSPDDIDDARRGHPSLSLQPFATQLGMDFRDRELVGSFVSTQPTWPDYVFNACRGRLPGGHYGLVEHELYETSIDVHGIQMGGSFYMTKATFKNDFGGLLGIGGSPPENAPFVGNSAWLPTTAVHVRVPETARLPPLIVFDADRVGKFGNADLAPYGLPGYYQVTTDHTGNDYCAGLAEVCRPWLSTRGDAFLRLRVRHGLVNLAVNGYRCDPADLRQLIAAAEGIGEGLAALTSPPMAVPFASPGPAVGTVPPLRGVPRPGPQWTAGFAETARTYGLHDEDPVHVQMLLASNPIPGVPWGVLFGAVPGATAPCRVVWHNQGGRTEHSCRGGIIVPARPGAATQLGGALYQPTAMYVEVVDGVAYAWNQQRSFGELQSQALLANGITALRATGVADI